MCVLQIYVKTKSLKIMGLGDLNDGEGLEIMVLTSHLPEMALSITNIIATIKTSDRCIELIYPNEWTRGMR